MGKAKLNSEEALDLSRRLIKEGRGSPKWLAPQYGVTVSVCYAIMCGAIWKKEFQQAQREAKAAKCNCPCCMKYHI